MPNPTTDACTLGSHLPDCELVESYNGHRFHECTRCDGCGALPGEMCWCGWPEASDEPEAKPAPKVFDVELPFFEGVA